jgi:hypothetical protein
MSSSALEVNHEPIGDRIGGAHDARRFSSSRGEAAEWEEGNVGDALGRSP